MTRSAVRRAGHRGGPGPLEYPPDRGPWRTAVRLGIHTGLVVVGAGAVAPGRNSYAGRDPNLAARLQGIATPNTLVISAATFQLLGGFFACQPLGSPPLKGQTQPLAVYRVLYEHGPQSLGSGRQHRVDPAGGREQESGLLRERWSR